MVPPSDSYAAAALKGEVDNVERAPEGTRNHQLFSSSAALFELVNAGALESQTVWTSMTDAGRTAGLEELEIERTIRSAETKTDGVARMVPERPEKPSPASSIGKNVDVPERADSPLGNLLLSPSGLRDLPEPEPLIENVLDQGTTALLFGRFGSMKSFTALDWACCVATGKSWQGRAAKRSRVLYVVAEGISGFAPRVDAWEAGWRTKIDDDSMRFYPRPVNLLGRDVDMLANEIEAGGYGLVILDTLARCMVGGDENSAKDAGIVIDSMTHLMHSTPDSRGVILALHHAGKGGVLRGSSAFEGGVDTVYQSEADGMTITLKRTKRKDGPKDDYHRLRLTPTMGTGSCIVQQTSDTGAGSDTVVMLKKIFVRMFSETGVSHMELRTIVAEQGMSHTDFGSARARLIEENWLMNSGTDTRPFWRMTDYAKGLENQF